MTEIHGHCDPVWAGVRDGFAKNFAEGDLGASACVIAGDEIVVDLWGGHRDLAATQPWERDTIVNVWSTTKMMAALCVLVLHDRGGLSVDEPVATYWPEFGANGKEGVLVKHVLSHTAGVAGYDEPITEEQIYDTPFCVERLAGQAPWWEPGTASGYHSSTQGPLLGEIVRRVDGRSLGTFFRDEIAGPLDADFHIGTPDAAFPRIAEMRTDEIDVSVPAGDGFAARVGRGEPSHASMVNSDRWRRFEQPASNGHGNARSVARIVSCLARGGVVDGHRLLSPATIERCFEVQADGTDLVLGLPTRFGIGFGLPSEGMPMGVNDRTLFWAGWGGSFAVVDVENEMTVVYVMNRMQDGTVGGTRSARVIFAAHAAAEARRGA
ncbi:MAG: serine hydrolase domain-containing protein [Acidimicrobiales bacterium]|nr:serine hydrolase domain-containing protein [Acidimicrobiales bacterium]